MKILMAVPWIPYPPTDGGRMRSYFLLREAARRHQVSLCCIRNPGESLDGLDSLNPLCQRVEVVPSGFSYSLVSKCRSVFGRLPFGAQEPGGELERRLLAWGRAADLIHIQGIELVSCVKPLLDHSPVVFDMVDCNSLQMRRRAQWERHPLRQAWYVLQAQKFQWAERAVSRLPVTTLLASRIDVDVLLDRCRHAAVQPQVLPNGVDVAAESSPPASSGAPRLVFTGNMAYGPNHDAVYYFCREILPRIHRQRPEVQFDILGKDPPPALVKLSQRMPHVTVVGFLPDLKMEMARRTLYVCPLRIGTGIKLKLLEAMACGMPIVASPTSVEGMLVEDGRHLLIGRSAQDFANKVLEALASSELRTRLGTEALRLVREHYTWASIGRTLEQLYQAVAHAS